jgi:hypothetical protein
LIKSGVFLSLSMRGRDPRHDPWTVAAGAMKRQGSDRRLNLQPRIRFDATLVDIVDKAACVFKEIANASSDNLLSNR